MFTKKTRIGDIGPVSHLVRLVYLRHELAHLNELLAHLDAAQMGFANESNRLVSYDEKQTL